MNVIRFLHILIFKDASTYQADAVQWAMTAQKAFDLCTPSKYHHPVNAAVGEACEMSPTSMQTKPLTLDKHHAALSHVCGKRKNSVSACHVPPDVIPKNVDGKRNARVDREAKRRTGFRSEKELLAFIIVVCNGDTNKIKKTNSTCRLACLDSCRRSFDRCP